MSIDKGQDPVTPTITFDNYVIPETVKERRTYSAAPFGTIFSNTSRAAPRKAAPEPAPVASPPQTTSPVAGPNLAATGIIVFMTFLLGVLTTLYFVNPREAVITAEMRQAAVMAMAAQHINAPAPVATVQPATPTAAVNDLEQAVSSSLKQDVTRLEPVDLITPTATGAGGPIDTTPLSMDEILLGLTPIRAADAPEVPQGEQTILNRDKLRLLREGVLSGDYTVRTTLRNGQERLMLRMPSTDVTQDEAADLLRQAAARGEIELPEALRTSDGDFDADTLIFNLVQLSLANDGTDAGLQAAKEMSRRAFAASKARTERVQGVRIYVVEPGDSLAYLSLQFYGQPSSYFKIFEANRNILTSPDMIQIGQRLIIPG